MTEPFDSMRGDIATHPEISVVTPIHNEGECIALHHERLRSALSAMGRPFEIIAVDDGSTDNSFALLRDIATRDSDFRVVRLRRNFGKTAAYSAGFARARGDILVTIDADLQDDAADIPRLVAKLDEGYDAVSGWRVERKDPFWRRRFPSIIANFLISWVTGVYLHDYGCGLKAYRAEIIRNAALGGELHRFIPAIASWQGIAVAELPVSHAPRLLGSSKYGLGRTVPVLLDLLTVRFLLSYSTRPMRIFGVFGLASLFAGLGINAYLVAIKLLTGAHLADRPLLLLGVLLIVVGIQFVGVGLIGELLVRSRSTGESPTYSVREELNRPAEQA